jgi:hypothetical protein
MVGRGVGHGRHVHGHPSPIEAYYRTRGGRRRDHLGFHFWAVWGSNWASGLEAKLLAMGYSTTLLKGS